MKAQVNEKACIRCGLCPTLCPEVFYLEDGDSARAITEDITEDPIKIRAQEAADSCPTAAITVK